MIIADFPTSNMKNESKEYCLLIDQLGIARRSISNLKSQSDQLRRRLETARRRIRELEAASIVDVKVLKNEFKQQIVELEHLMVVANKGKWKYMKEAIEKLTEDTEKAVHGLR